MEALLTQAEVAERVRRPVATLRFWRHKGIGPKSANVGGRVLYRESDVQKWLAEQFGDRAPAEPGAA
jgi:DNA-binding transcriptional MerR regulator